MLPQSEEIATSKKKLGRSTFSHLGVLAVIGGALLLGGEDILAYLLLGLATVIIGFIKTSPGFDKKKDRVALLISGAIVTGALIQTVFSLGQPVLYRQISLLIILVGGVSILTEKLYRCQQIDRG
jgi:hypothetical protein